jgi:soluble P-type ATPase
MPERKSIAVAVPGRPPVTLSCLVLDYNGTLAGDGSLLPGVSSRLRKLARKLRIIVVTADTFGTAQTALRGLPVEVKSVEIGLEKLRLVRQLGPEHVMAIENGRNDVQMIRAAAIGVAVIGPEGAAGELIGAADVVVRDIRDALDLPGKPLKLRANLRP